MIHRPIAIETIRILYEEGDAAHDFDHVLRVTELAQRIAQAEGADVEIVRLAALLHDVPIESPAGAASRRKAHHLLAADFAQGFLIERGVLSDRAEKIVHCIEAHRFRDQSIQPQTLEAQSLYDADKLDSIGAIGVGRAFAYAGAHESRLWTEPVETAPAFSDRPTGADYTPVHEYVYKLQRLLDTLHTESARKIGARRHQFMTQFYAQLDAEMTGAA